MALSSESTLNGFLKALGLTTLALFGVSAVLSAFWPALRLLPGWAGFLLMAANAFAAVAILRLRTGMEPVKLILTSTLVRSFLMAAVMLSVVALAPRGAGLYSFVFSAMVGFVAYQAVEIRHIVRAPELLAK